VHIRVKDENPIQNWKEVKSLFQDVSVELIEKHADSFEEGLQAATQEKEALLVMIRHKQSFWERLFNISDSRKALMHSKLPVLVVPEN
jgi:nucleotide-binding universal stress UspA family protein